MVGTFNIELDYRFAPPDAFSEVDKARIEEAARIWESFITDSFREIPTGTTVNISNPQTFETEIFTLTEPWGDLRIFLAAEPIAPIAAFASPSFLAVEEISSPEITAAELNEETIAGFNSDTDFEPRMGTLTFDVDDQGNAEVNVALAIHEMGHILGIGSSDAFGRLINANSLFEGENATALNNGQPIPIYFDQGHIDAGFTLADGISPVVGPGVGDGLPTALDLAVLSDIGWDIPVITEREVNLPTLDYVRQGTGGDDSIIASETTTDGDTVYTTFINRGLFGQNGNDILYGGQGNDLLIGSYFRTSSGSFAVFDGEIELFGDYLQPDDGADQLYGEAGDDDLRGNGGDDFLEGGTGNDALQGDLGRDTFFFDRDSGVDTIRDFVVSDDFIRVSSNLGFRSPSELLDALSDPVTQADGQLVSTLALSDQDQVTITHDAALSTSNLIIDDPLTNFDLDLDGNNTTDALTDGVLALRYLFGFRGETLTEGATAPDSTRTSAEIEAYLADIAEGGLDIDSNGVADALTDGVLALRYLFGFRGDTLTEGAIASDATRTTANAIESHLGSITTVA